jgi:hypothetical protein
MIVSTVLRPVGPRPPWVYWLRRAVIIGVILVLIVVLAEACSGGSSTPPAASKSPGAHPSSSASSATSSADAVAACDPTALKLVLSTDSDSYPAGQQPKLIGVFTNSSSSSCTLDVSPSTETWTVKSGSDTIWTTHGCTSSGAVKHTTIKAGGTKTRSTIWNGHRLDPDCATGAEALVGEYTLHATLDGVKGQIAVFHITS